MDVPRNACHLNDFHPDQYGDDLMAHDDQPILNKPDGDLVDDFLSHDLGHRNCDERAEHWHRQVAASDCDYYHVAARDDDDQPVTVEQLLDAYRDGYDDNDRAREYSDLRRRAAPAVVVSHNLIQAALDKHRALTPAERSIFDARVRNT